ncbi:MAG: hypothetical protein PVG79_10550 [Gemmatimonadales bacterium]|jgi:hypothetical protein
MAALLAGCSDEPVTPTEYAAPSLSVAGNSGPSANGQAKLYFSGELQNVSFHAREMEDGSVSGSFESKSRAHTIEVHAKLDCLVVDGNEAILGGVFTQVRAGPDMPWKICVGDRLWFKVRDNGEGAGADPDEFTDWYWEGCGVATATQCGEYPFEEWPGWIPGFIPIEGGNVQVKG